MLRFYDFPVGKACTLLITSQNQLHTTFFKPSLTPSQTYQVQSLSGKQPQCSHLYDRVSASTCFGWPHTLLVNPTTFQMIVMSSSLGFLINDFVFRCLIQSLQFGLRHVRCSERMAILPLQPNVRLFFRIKTLSPSLALMIISLPCSSFRHKPA